MDINNNHLNIHHGTSFPIATDWRLRKHHLKKKKEKEKLKKKKRKHHLSK